MIQVSRDERTLGEDRGSGDGAVWCADTVASPQIRGNAGDCGVNWDNMQGF